MRKTIEVTSNLFDRCGTCDTAEGYGEDAINVSLHPAADNLRPPKPTEVHAVVRCEEDPDGTIIADTDITYNGKATGLIGGTVPINCPALEKKE